MRERKYKRCIVVCMRLANARARRQRRRTIIIAGQATSAPISAPGGSIARPRGRKRCRGIYTLAPRKTCADAAFMCARAAPGTFHASVYTSEERAFSRRHGSAARCGFIRRPIKVLRAERLGASFPCCFCLAARMMLLCACVVARDRRRWFHWALRENMSNTVRRSTELVGARDGLIILWGRGGADDALGKEGANRDYTRFDLLFSFSPWFLASIIAHAPCVSRMIRV